jgi:hypothetical protein
LIGTIAANTAFADAGGNCHFHGKKEASEETIMRCSQFHRERLAKKGAIDASWNTIKHDSLKKVAGQKGREEWQIIFSDPAAADITKKKLFLFFTLNGNFLAANHTGN